MLSPFSFCLVGWFFPLQARQDLASTLVTALQPTQNHSQSALPEAELPFCLQTLISDTSQENNLPSEAETLAIVPDSSSEQPLFLPSRPN